jgi:Na+/melibiose symporter-like transporter
MTTEITSNTTENGTTTTVKAKPSIFAIIAGLLVFLVGATLLYIDGLIAIANKQTPHTGHLILAAVVCVIGVVIAFAAYVIPPLKQLSVVVWPYVPVLGGRRQGDPQTPTAPLPPPPQPPPPGPPL